MSGSAYALLVLTMLAAITLSVAMARASQRASFYNHAQGRAIAAFKAGTLTESIEKIGERVSGDIIFRQEIEMFKVWAAEKPSVRIYSTNGCDNAR